MAGNYLLLPTPVYTIDPEQHMFELCGLTYMWGFFSQYLYCFWSAVGNCRGPPVCIDLCHFTQETWSSVILVFIACWSWNQFPADTEGQLTLGESKVIHGLSSVWGVSTQSPCYSIVNCILMHSLRQKAGRKCSKCQVLLNC